MLDFGFQAYSDDARRDIMIVAEVSIESSFEYSYSFKTRVRYSTIKDVGFTQVPKVLGEKVKKKLSKTIHKGLINKIIDVIEINNMVLEAWYD